MLNLNLIIVVILEKKLDKIGIVSDFGVLKVKLNSVLVKMDHVCLNDLEYFKKDNPTTENIAKYIYKSFAKKISPLKVKCVKVWESETSSVVYYE